MLAQLKALREADITESISCEVPEFAKGVKLVGRVYRLVGTAIEVTGKALETPETINELSHCFNDIKNPALDSVIALYEKHENDYNEVIQEFQEMEKEYAPHSSAQDSQSSSDSCEGEI